jgi:hypothetical protein
MDASVLLSYYALKRMYVAIDEWLTYAMLLLLLCLALALPHSKQWERRVLFRVLAGASVFGTWCIWTAYKNLGIIERALALTPPQYMLYPM